MRLFFSRSIRFPLTRLPPKSQIRLNMRKPSAEKNVLPPISRGMMVLDRSFFKKKIPLLIANFPNPKFLGEFVKVCRDDVLKIRGVKPFTEIHGSKGVLLRDDINDIDTYKEKLSPLALEKIKEQEGTVEPYELLLDYNFWKLDDILQSVLPEELLKDYPSGYAQAGHVAHLNLRPEFKPYGKLIAQVIIDKVASIETVVNKLDTIDTKFRTFKMEVLAGRDDLIVHQTESGCKFAFNFSTVYWNSRLSTEHERIIKTFTPGEAVADVFAGVGPFAVPAGKKDVFVIANDLNPESYKYLLQNIKDNHVTDFVKEYNLDGREFIRDSPSMLLKWKKELGEVKKEKNVKRSKVDPESKEVITQKFVQEKIVFVPKFFSHYAMNLPDSAITFLNEFIGLYVRDPEVEELATKDPDFKLPLVNVHCFEKFSAEEPEPTLDVLQRRVHARIVKVLEFEKPYEEFLFHLVRKVSPTKQMFCVSFELPREVAFRI